MARIVEEIAASWGLFPKGAEIKNDQLANDSPNNRCTMSIKPTLVSENIRYRQTKATIIQAGRYAEEILRCHELQMWGD
jgi:hypothetical protein